MAGFTTTNVRDKILEMESLPETDFQARRREDYEAAKEAMKALGKVINGGSPDCVALGLLAALANEHRYLQQNLVQILFTVLGNLPDIEGEDARNQFSMKLCRTLRKKFKEDLFWEDPV